MTGTVSGRAVATVNPEMLKGIALFQGLGEPALQLIARELPTHHVEVGKVIIQEGDEAREMYVVLAGELEVTKHSPSGVDHRVALLGPGDWFGDMSIVDPRPRSASVRAIAPTLLLRMSSSHLEDGFFKNDLPTYAILMRNVARELSRRLRVADHILSNMVVNVSDAYRAGPAK